jgi:multidrug efflux pump subunit AcrB
MTTIDATMNRLAAGDGKIEAAAFAFRTYAVAMLAGALVTIAGFIPVGFAAVVDASSSRFRPIMLTAVSTVLGLIPIAPTVFWGPMAFAIMGGLLVGTLLTLIFLPTLYATWFGGREKAA